MIKIILPELGEKIERATISYWYAQEGSQVREKDDLLELTTDKSTFNLPSPASGILTQIIFHEGDTVNVGEILGIIDAG
ncbi:MAG: biotin/lipoyl-containing protein [Candidatus Omnitrophota bacterium]